MIARDLPEVIADRDVAQGVENMAYNFFKPQPVKGGLFSLRSSVLPLQPLPPLSVPSFHLLMHSLGASIYLFCHIIHDWPDVACHQILSNTIAALTPNHSRIVIMDQVFPTIGISAFSAFLDLTMMTFAGTDRTERQWRDLLEAAGLTLIRIEGPKVGSLSLDRTIEAVLRR